MLIDAAAASAAVIEWILNVFLIIKLLKNQKKVTILLCVFVN